MTIKKEQVCWDSCIFIDKLQERSGRVAFIDPLIRLAEQGSLKIVASSMAIVETVNVKNIQPLEEVCLINEFFRRKIIALRNVDRPIAEKAQEIRREYRDITPTDAAHLATALITETPYFLTTDGLEPKRKGALLPLDKKIDGLRIVTPEKYLAEKLPHLSGSYGLVGTDK